MKVKYRSLLVVGSCLATLISSHGQVVINEFQYDDATATDDREFIELFNKSATPIDISGWSVASNDNLGPNTGFTIPAGTILQPGAFWVIGSNNVLNVNQVIPANSLENDNESLELYDNNGVLKDAVAYETNAGLTMSTFATIASEVGPGYWSNHNTSDGGSGSALIPFTSVGRFVDGRDTNNNGRDFGLRPATPGSTNAPGGIITQYNAPNVDALADGARVGGLSGSFVHARVITPGVVSAANPNPIPEPRGGTKAIVAWDESGGGNAVASDAVFGGGGRFDIQVYLDTNNLPPSRNNVGTPFTGSEETFYGIGGGDALSNLADVGGKVYANSTSKGINGITGVAWYYEKVAGGLSEKLFLVDTGDGGESNSGRAGYDWTVLAAIDLSSTESGWFNLSLSILPDGTGTAAFNDQLFTFTTTPNLVGSFHVDYRENTQDGTILVPSYLRPPTFAAIPEPSATATLGLCALAAGFRRRRSK